MCWQHTQTNTHTHTHTHTQSSPPCLSPSLSFFFNLLWPERTLLVYSAYAAFSPPAASEHVYELWEDERGWGSVCVCVCAWVCLCLSVWRIKEDSLSPTHVSTDEYLWSPGLQEDAGLLLFCMYNVQIGIHSRRVWSWYTPCVYKHVPFLLCVCVARSKCHKCA